MSSQPPGRALAFPIVLGANLKDSGTVPETRANVCPSDEDAMARLQANNSNALRILYDRYSRLVFRIALAVVHDRGEAEDVVQEAFFYLYQRSTLFDASKGNAKAWIVQIAFHRALDKKSHLARRGFYHSAEIGSLDDTLLGATDLDREVGAKFERAQLEKAFETLPEPQRRTLELFYFEGLLLREISEKLNEPLGNIRHYFYRGMDRLRKSVFVLSLRGMRP